jgi:hypothetical protein
LNVAVVHGCLRLYSLRSTSVLCILRMSLSVLTRGRMEWC